MEYRELKAWLEKIHPEVLNEFHIYEVTASLAELYFLDLRSWLTSEYPDLIAKVAAQEQQQRIVPLGED